MEKFRDILFVSHGVTEDTDALKQALSIARNDKAALKALVVCPDLPGEMADYREKYQASLLGQLKASLQAARDAVGVSEADIPVAMEAEAGNMPAVRIICHVIRNAHDLVIKEAEPKEGGKGFRAVDMALLRQCPCPVWLSRPVARRRDEMKIAVAIDPENTTPEGHDLSLRLLRLSRALADSCSGELNIVSCWDYEFEKTLRHNPWIKMPEEDLKKTVDEARRHHRAALDALTLKSGIEGKVQVHHARGAADEMIPQYAADQNIDVLVMGTVARTGIAGFIIGNTAENTVQRLECSLLALKPHGFVSPVKAY